MRPNPRHNANGEPVLQGDPSQQDQQPEYTGAFASANLAQLAQGKDNIYGAGCTGRHCREAVAKLGLLDTKSVHAKSRLQKAQRATGDMKGDAKKAGERASAFSLVRPVGLGPTLALQPLAFSHFRPDLLLNLGSVALYLKRQCDRTLCLGRGDDAGGLRGRGQQVSRRAQVPAVPDGGLPRV
jgi:hypothetical protein